MIREVFILGLFLLLTVSGRADAGLLDSIQKGIDMLAASSDATQKAARSISDEEEYFLGRAVAARILETYPLLKDPKLTEYVNTIGSVLALHAERPYTYGGYHFAVLDTGEMNAFACPGGIVFITQGMLKAVASEDELAAVLAHEIAHVNHRDGIASIKNSRWTEAAAIIGTKAAQNYGPQELSGLTSIFEGSIDDIFKTLVVKGYSKSMEYGADKTAISYLGKSGYEPAALQAFLDRMVSSGKTYEGGILKTHPGTADRIDNMRADMPKDKGDTLRVGIRTARFSAAMN